ncbi:hypothetical protein [Aurantimonas sp. C2-5-R2]|uniref:hypothetical protein n=1 Tax=Aurantimonas sp. C2-5-R2 TaxID=3113713 RepID=UPI003FA52FEF
MAGADGIAIDATRRDPAPPPAFDGIVHPDDHGTIRHEAEATIDSARAFLYAASIMLLVRRIARAS